MAIDDVIEGLGCSHNAASCSARASKVDLIKDFQEKTIMLPYGFDLKNVMPLADQAIVMHPARLIVMWRLLIVQLRRLRLVSLLRCKTGSFVRMAIIEAILNGKA